MAVKKCFLSCGRNPNQLWKQFLNTLYSHITIKFASSSIRTMDPRGLPQRSVTFDIHINTFYTMKFSMKFSKKHDSKYELENRWKYFSWEMSQTTFPGHWKGLRWCLRRYFLEKPWIFHAFSCFLTTVGISIVNARIVASLYSNAHFCPLWGLPSRVPQHRTHLGVFVFCTDFRWFLPGGICAGFKRRCHWAFSRGVQKVSQKNRP